MHEQISYFSAFLVGFLGVVHCAGMCGGILGALTISQAADRGFQKLSILLAYNLARISSYTIAGALMGGFGWFATSWIEIHVAQGVLQLMAGLFMLALGLYLGGWWFGLNQVEQIGSHFWRRVEPLGRRLMPVKNIKQAFALGMVWGWLPCGLVYSVLIWTMSSGSFVKGALMMASFGLGTLPNLLLMGLFAGSLLKYFQNPVIKKLAGALVVVFAAWMLVQAVAVIRHGAV